MPRVNETKQTNVADRLLSPRAWPHHIKRIRELCYHANVSLPDLATLTEAQASLAIRRLQIRINRKR